MQRDDNVDALIIGAGPAGLMAAETLAAAGHRVLVAEAKPSVARKLLMAGKSGLNLTKAEPCDQFIAHYPEGRAALAPILTAFGPDEVMRWAGDLGQPLFTGSTGRVFPKVMKASPLLRAWLARLDDMGVMRRTRWRWMGGQGGSARFDTPEGEVGANARTTILALGGGSWARLGSDGAWVDILTTEGVEVEPFRPSNVGLRVAWSDHMQRHFGAPIKNTAFRCGDQQSRGEAVISRHGLEGGGLYPLGPALRQGHDLSVDLVPDVSLSDLTRRLQKPKGKSSLKDHLRKAARLTPVQIALLQEFARPLPQEAAALAQIVKGLPVHHSGLRPLDEAISTAGGVALSAVDEDLMLRARPGTFVAGEMLAWDAPTGGYLLTACLATGRWAGLAAARRLS